MAIEKYLDLSTAHLTDEDRKILEGPYPFGDYGPRLAVHEYGWICYLGEDGQFGEDADQAGMSQHFVNIVRYAIGHGCSLINFDQDGPEIEELPTFEW
jgi:hypothetical protein